MLVPDRLERIGGQMTEAESALLRAVMELSRMVCDLGDFVMGPMPASRFTIDYRGKLNDHLRELYGIYEALMKQPAETEPANDGFHERITALEDHRREREADAARPLSVKIIDTRKKQDEKV
jgi:hypothetical protein